MPTWWLVQTNANAGQGAVGSHSRTGAIRPHSMLELACFCFLLRSI